MARREFFTKNPAIHIEKIESTPFVLNTENIPFDATTPFLITRNGESIPNPHYVKIKKYRMRLGV